MVKPEIDMGVMVAEQLRRNQKGPSGSAELYFALTRSLSKLGSELKTTELVINSQMALDLFNRLRVINGVARTKIRQSDLELFSDFGLLQAKTVTILKRTLEITEEDK